MKASKN